MLGISWAIVFLSLSHGLRVHLRRCVRARLLPFPASCPLSFNVTPGAAGGREGAAAAVTLPPSSETCEQALPGDNGVIVLRLFFFPLLVSAQFRSGFRNSVDNSLLSLESFVLPFRVYRDHH